jgi:hypothetical protein
VDKDDSLFSLLSDTMEKIKNLENDYALTIGSFGKTKY